jgi:hypothetical protein
MQRTLAAALLAAVFTSAQPASARPEPPLDQALKAMIQARVDAFAGDGETYRRLLRETEEADYAYTNEVGVFRDSADDGSDWFPGLMQARPRGVVHSLDLQRYGDTAVANYTLDLQLTFNRETMVKRFQVTEVFHRSGRKWRSVARHESVAPGPPHWAAAIDTAVYDDYVGRYELLPGVDYAITRRDDRLYWGEGEDAVLLTPESSATFATGPEGMGYRMIFLRGEGERVYGVRIREFSGVEYTAVRKP